MDNDVLLYVDRTSALYHHGVEGQRWGVQNGPPYPLSPEKASKLAEYKSKELTKLRDTYIKRKKRDNNQVTRLTKKAEKQIKQAEEAKQKLKEAKQKAKDNYSNEITEKKSINSMTYEEMKKEMATVAFKTSVGVAKSIVVGVAGAILPVIPGPTLIPLMMKNNMPNATKTKVRLENEEKKLYRGERVQDSREKIENKNYGYEDIINYYMDKIE